MNTLDFQFAAAGVGRCTLVGHDWLMIAAYFGGLIGVGTGLRDHVSKSWAYNGISDWLGNSRL